MLSLLPTFETWMRYARPSVQTSALQQPYRNRVLELAQSAYRWFGALAVIPRNEHLRRVFQQGPVVLSFKAGGTRTPENAAKWLPSPAGVRSVSNSKRWFELAFEAFWGPIGIIQLPYHIWASIALLPGFLWLGTCLGHKFTTTEGLLKPYKGY